MGYLLTSWSAEQDRTGDPAIAGKMERLSGGGLVVYFLTVTFAMVDWTMSVNPHWFSTIWGMLYIGGQGLSAFAFGILVLVMLSQTAPLNKVLTTHHFHDLGKFLFAFLMLWAYLSFSQLLIIWSANIPEEIPHYLIRWETSWQLPERLHHRRPLHRAVRAAAVARPEEELPASCAWWRPGSSARASPTTTGTWRPSSTRRLDVSLLDVALPLALGGIFISIFVSQLAGRSLLPVNDAGLEKALTHHVH